MHGTHQLAKKLTSRGCPDARLDELRPGRAGSAAGKVKAGTGLPSSLEGTSLLVGVARRHTSAMINSASSASGAKRTARVKRNAPCAIAPWAHAGAAATVVRTAPARRRTR